MNTQSIVRSAKIYLRSEALVAEILLQVYARKFFFAAIALLAFALALVFANLAALFFLQSLWGPIWAPMVICLANLLIAAVAIAAAAFVHPGQDLELARELRNTSSKALEDEFQNAPSIGSLGGRLAGGGQEGIVKLLLPVVISIVTSLSRRKSSAKSSSK